MKLWTLLPLFLVLTIDPTTTTATPQNMALGCKYTLKPAPNYHLCTDPADKTQLTDGICSEGYFWTQSATVGWRNARPVEITIDMAKPRPISGLSFSTAAGTAGVQWPMSISILVSDDDRTYRLAADLIELSAVENGEPQASPYSTHRFTTNALRTHARFVKLLVFTSGPYCFTDEIEIYKGPDAFLDEPLPRRTITDVHEFYVQTATVRGVRRRLARHEEKRLGLLDRPGPRPDTAVLAHAQPPRHPCGPL